MPFTKYNSNDKIKKNRIGGVCGTYGTRRGAYSVWWGNLREIDNLVDPGMDRKVILKLIFKKWTEGGA